LEVTVRNRFQPTRSQSPGVSPSLLAYEAKGSGEPILLLHGLSASHRWWSQNAPVFARSYRVYAIDLSGFGDSRELGVFDLNEAVPQVIHWMDALEIPRATVIGHSLGGLIAVMLAAQEPTRVERLVLVDAAMLAFNPGLGRRALGLVRSLRWTPKRHIPMMAEDALRANPRAVSHATLQLLTTDGRSDLKRITAPTLIIWGEHDTIVPLSVGEQLQAQISGSQLVVIPNSSHTPMLDRPQRFNEEVFRFLRTTLIT